MARTPLPPGYHRQHKKVYRTRGKASDQECESCGSPAHHWAWIHDTDREDPFNYRALCRPCHFGYDDLVSKIADRQRGVPETPESVTARIKSLQGTRRKHSKSGIPGVFRHSQNGNWQVQVNRKAGGCYTDFTDAVEARNALALNQYGPTAKQYNTDGSLIGDDDLSAYFLSTQASSSPSFRNY